MTASHHLKLKTSSSMISEAVEEAASQQLRKRVPGLGSSRSYVLSVPLSKIRLFHLQRKHIRVAALTSSPLRSCHPPLPLLNGALPSALPLLRLLYHLVPSLGAPSNRSFTPSYPIHLCRSPHGAKRSVPQTRSQLVQRRLLKRAPGWESKGGGYRHREPGAKWPLECGARGVRCERCNAILLD